MSLIDPEYQAQLQQLHNAGKFNHGLKAYKLVKPFIEMYQPKSLLDFGCGQGALIQCVLEFHPGTIVAGYDPGSDVFQQMPAEQFESVVSTDALEHVELQRLEETLKILNDKFTKCAFLRIACYPAKKHLPDGRNAHLIVESPDWWRAQLQQHLQANIVDERIQVVDKSAKWPHVIGHNYDVTLVK
jgi:cyclopropane fatty-acyl-phospholipid synthase-like methyltransferase